MGARRALGMFVACAMVAVAAMAPPARGSTGDPRSGEQWALDLIGAPAAWTRTDGSGVTVAVVDTGVDAAHADLVAGIAAHVNCIGADGDPARCSGSGLDDHGHGTHVAGIVGARRGNGIGVAGVAPEAELLVARALAREPTGSASGSLADVRAAIAWAVDRGADVVNLSLGENVAVRNLFGSGLADAVRAAWERGVIVVIAAGNLPLLFPAGYDDLDALVVTATDRHDDQAGYATDVGEAKWGLAAPGGDGSGADEVLSTWWKQGQQNQYEFLSGTSMAAPHVSGAAALLRSAGLSPQATIDRLLSTARDLGTPGPDSVFGYGRLDAGAAAALPGTGNAGSPGPGLSGAAPKPESQPASAAPRVVVRGAQAEAPAAAGASDHAPAPPADAIEGAAPLAPVQEPAAVTAPPEDARSGPGGWAPAAAIALLMVAVPVWRRVRRVPTARTATE